MDNRYFGIVMDGNEGTPQTITGTSNEGGWPLVYDPSLSRLSDYGKFNSYPNNYRYFDPFIDTMSLSPVTVIAKRTLPSLHKASKKDLMNPHYGDSRQPYQKYEQRDAVKSSDYNLSPEVLQQRISNDVANARPDGISPSESMVSWIFPTMLSAGIGPALGSLSDAFYATNAGQKVLPYATAAYKTLTNPWVDAGLSAYFGSQVPGNIQRGEYAEAALNSLPLTIPLYKGAEATYKAGKSLYNTGKEVIESNRVKDTIQGLKDFAGGVGKDYSTVKIGENTYGIKDYWPDDNITIFDKPHVISTGPDDISTHLGSVSFGGKGPYKGLNLGGADASRPGAVEDLKELMRNSPNSTAFSGDPYSVNLGTQLINDFNNRKFGSFFKHLFTNTSEPLQAPLKGGMSPDAMSMLYRMAKDEPDKFHISYGTTPAGDFNWLSKSGGRNAYIYDAQEAYKDGLLTADDYVNTVNKWLEPLGGRPAEVVNGVPKVWQPFLVRGGRAAKEAKGLGKPSETAINELFPVGNPQIRPYNATTQEPPAISWGDVVEPNTTKAAVESAVESNPFKYKGNNNIDTFRHFLFNDQINAFLNGKSTDLLGHRLPDTWKSTHIPFPESVQAEINNSMMPRIANQRRKYWGDEYDKLYEKYKDDPTVWLPEKDVFIESRMREDLRHYNATISQGYDLGSESFFQDYQKAEGIKDKKVLGLQIDSSGRIIARDGVEPEKVLGHEWGHRRTNINSGGSELTPSEDKILSDAYGDDFVGLSNTVEDFKSMNLKNERNTLNSDARRELIGEYHSQKTNVELQNKIIDKKTDEQVFAAVEHADGYGKEYIKYLREHGKLTHEKANFFRTAMKEVGMYGLPVTIGGSLLYGIGQENNNEIQ